MRKFSKSRRRLKKAGLFACVLLLLVLAAASFWFVDYARIQPPRVTLVLVLGWFAVIAILLTSALMLLRDWHKGDTTPYCPNCEYDLTGNESGHCPECGNAIPRGDLTLSGRPPLVDGNPLEKLQDAASHARSKSTRLFLIYLAFVGSIMLIVCIIIWGLARGCPPY